MRISDWSSDVCSSDLHRRQHRDQQYQAPGLKPGHLHWKSGGVDVGATVETAASSTPPDVGATLTSLTTRVNSASCTGPARPIWTTADRGSAFVNITAPRACMSESSDHNESAHTSP